MATSKYKIMEQCRSILGKGDPQELMVAVTQAFGTVVRQHYFQGKEEGVNEIQGVFIYTFFQSVTLDTTRDKYCATLPASYISLPYEYGITSVSYTKGDDTPFVRINAGQFPMFKGLMSEGMEGNQTYFIEGSKIFLPKIESWDDAETLMVKLAVSLDGVDDDTAIFLPPDVQDAIITLVLQKYAPQEPKEKLN